MSIKPNELETFQKEINKYRNCNGKTKAVSDKEVEMLSKLGILCDLSYTDFISKFMDKEYEKKENDTTLSLSKSKSTNPKRSRKEYTEVKIDREEPHNFEIECAFYYNDDSYIQVKTSVKKPSKEMLKNSKGNKEKLYFAYQNITIGKDSETLSLDL